MSGQVHGIIEIFRKRSYPSEIEIIREKVRTGDPFENDVFV